MHPGLTVSPEPVSATLSGSSFRMKESEPLWALQELVALFHSPDLVLKASSVLWGIFLVLSVFALVLEGTGDRFPAWVSDVLTDVSTKVLVGEIVGILAN
jgi:hypothetical protein